MIFIDMDGVLVDFLEGATKTLNDFGHPGFEDPHWKAFDDKDKNCRYQIISGKKEFWLNLDPMPDAMTLWQYVAPLKPHILSATPESHHVLSCKLEKMLWLNKHLDFKDIGDVHLVKRERKQHFAVGRNGQPNVLIDDYIKNIEEWTAAGGIGILHTTAATTIDELIKLELI